MQPVITLDRVKKRYNRYRAGSIREAFAGLNPFRRTNTTPVKDRWLWAIDDLSLQIMPGQTLGVIGPNGAGKTTILKLLSGITQPTQGYIQVNGRVSALIELGAGFHPDLTGRENIYLNGTILGMKRREIAQRFDQIVSFSGLQPFIDTPVKYYSSGMYARLGFSVAVHTNPDLLLVDEVLAVGDYSFQQQCYQRMQTLQSNGTTILLVSHNLAAINDICNTVIVMDQGKLAFNGSTPEGLVRYAELIRKNVSTRDQIRIGEDGIGQRVMTHRAKIQEVRLQDEKGNPVRVIRSGDQVFLLAKIKFFEDAPHPHFSCFVHDSQGRLIYDQTTLWKGVNTPNYSEGQTSEVIYRLKFNVVEGIYDIGIDLHYSDLSCYYDRIESAVSLVIDDSDGAKGIADLDCDFQFSDLANV